MLAMREKGSTLAIFLLIGLIYNNKFSLSVCAQSQSNQNDTSTSATMYATSSVPSEEDFSGTTGVEEQIAPTTTKVIQPNISKLVTTETLLSATTTAILTAIKPSETSTTSTPDITTKPTTSSAFTVAEVSSTQTSISLKPTTSSSSATLPSLTFAPALTPTTNNNNDHQKFCFEVEITNFTTTCQNCYVNLNVTCPPDSRQLTTGKGLSDCSLSPSSNFDDFARFVSIPGCRHVCQNNVTIRHCCSGYWGIDCQGLSGSFFIEMINYSINAQH